MALKQQSTLLGRKPQLLFLENRLKYILSSDMSVFDEKRVCLSGAGEVL